MLLASLVRRRRKILRGLLLLGLALCTLPTLSGCGGTCTDLGTYPGTYSFTVTATPAAGAVKSKPIQLTVTLPK